MTGDLIVVGNDSNSEHRERKKCLFVCSATAEHEAMIKSYLLFIRAKFIRIQRKWTAPAMITNE